MATQSIEVKDFTGGRNFITSPFNLYPTEAPVFSNISLDTTGMRTRNLRPNVQLLAARGENPIQVAPVLGEAYDLSFAESSYLEKVRFYQGNRYIIKSGTPYMLGDNDELFSTTVDNTLSATAPQEAYTPTGAIGVEHEIVQYTYYISYRSAAGFESALEEIDVVNGLIQWDANFTTQTASNQDIVVAAPPAAGDYGRIYRMGNNISFPSLVFQFDSAWVVTLSSGLVVSNAGTFSFALLDHELGGYATTWGAVYPEDLQYLTATKYGLAAAKGSQIYLSMNKPDAWSELSMLNLGSKITGIASIYKGFLIFTQSAYLYMVTGAGISSLQINLLSTDIGCTSNSAIAEVSQHALVWVYARRFYMFTGSSVRELEPNTYDFDYFIRKGFTNEATAISMYNKYYIGSDLGVTILDFNHRYKPFIDFDMPPEFRNVQSCYMREIEVKGERLPGMYKDDSSFWSLDTITYKGVNYQDLVPPTDNWGIGCYEDDIGAKPLCSVEDETSCLQIGCFGAIPNCVVTIEACMEWLEDDCIDNEGDCIAPSGGCTDGAVVGLYPEDFTQDLIPVQYLSNYYSPMFTFGNMNEQCTFSSIEVLFEGELSIFAYIDDREIVFRDNYASSEPKTARLPLPNHEARGSFLQVRLVFNGAIYGYRVNGEPLRQYSK